MTIFDFAVLIILGVSILISIIRGFVREVLALISWVVAFIVARTYATHAVSWLPPAIPGETLRLAVSFIVIFLLSLLFMSIIAISMAELIKVTRLSAVDRGLGAVFGLARAAVIIMTLVLVAGLTALPQRPEWQNAMLSTPLESTALRLKLWLPQSLAKHIRYSK